MFNVLLNSHLTADVSYFLKMGYEFDFRRTFTFRCF